MSDKDGYRLEIAIQLNLGTPVTSTTAAKPGFTDVYLPATGTLTVKNVTDGHDYRFITGAAGETATTRDVGSPQVMMNYGPETAMCLLSFCSSDVSPLVDDQPAQAVVFTIAPQQSTTVQLGRTYPDWLKVPKNTIGFEVPDAQVAQVKQELVHPTTTFLLATNLSAGTRCGYGWVVLSSSQSSDCQTYQFQ